MSSYLSTTSRAPSSRTSSSTHRHPNQPTTNAHPQDTDNYSTTSTLTRHHAPNGNTYYEVYPPWSPTPGNLSMSAVRPELDRGRYEKLVVGDDSTPDGVRVFFVQGGVPREAREAEAQTMARLHEQARRRNPGRYAEIHGGGGGPAQGRAGSRRGESRGGESAVSGSQRSGSRRAESVRSERSERGERGGDRLAPQERHAAPQRREHRAPPTSYRAPAAERQREYQQPQYLEPARRSSSQHGGSRHGGPRHGGSRAGSVAPSESASNVSTRVSSRSGRGERREDRREERREYREPARHEPLRREGSVRREGSIGGSRRGEREERREYHPPSGRERQHQQQHAQAYQQQQQQRVQYADEGQFVDDGGYEDEGQYPAQQQQASYEQQAPARRSSNREPRNVVTPYGLVRRSDRADQSGQGQDAAIGPSYPARRKNGKEVDFDKGFGRFLKWTLT